MLKHSGIYLHSSAETAEENLRPAGQYLDDRMATTAQAGVIANKGLAEKFRISSAALSQWLKLKMDKGELAWCTA